MATFLRRLKYFLRRDRLARELADEIEFHRSLTSLRLEHEGMAPQDAETASRRLMGNITLAREDVRAIWIWPAIDKLWLDLRCAIRMLRRQPSFAVTAILTLAVGIGATTTVVSVVEAELLKPLPFPDAHRLVGVYTTGPRARLDSASLPDLLDWRAQSRAFDELAAFRSSRRRVLRGSGTPESIRVMPVTSNFFATLRLLPSRGRPFAAEDDAAAEAVILTDSSWRRFFSADPLVIGKAITLDDKAHIIVGVLGPEARLEFMREPDAFAVLDPRLPPRIDRSARDLHVIGRLRDQVDVTTADTEIRSIAQRVSREYPTDYNGRGTWVAGLRETSTGWNWRPLLFFLGAAVFVLLLSCVNVANLLLARALGRQREFAIRGALGGGRAALVRQLLVEGSLLAFPGAALGLMLAAWALQLLPAWLPPSYLDRGGHFALDARVYLIALAATGLTALTFGLVPGLFATRRAVHGSLGHGEWTVSGSPFHRRARHALVVVEIGLTLVLLVSAGLFLNSFARLTHIPLGFDPVGRLAMRVDLTGAPFAEPGQIVEFSTQLIARARAVPGIAAAAVASDVPLGSAMSIPFAVPGDGGPSIDSTPPVVPRAISPGLLSVLGIHRLAGRDFTADDIKGAPRVALINEHLARRAFSGKDPVGQYLDLRPPSTSKLEIGLVQIVGVVGNIKNVGMNEVDFNNVYLPIAQSPLPTIHLVVHATVPPLAAVDALRAEIHRLDPNLPVIAVTSMEQRVRDALRGDRFHLLLIGTFAIAGLVLAAVGIYGVMSYAIEQRRREFGVRLALGARPAEILALALGQCTRLGLAGAALGLALSLTLAKLLGNALYLVEREHEGLIYGVRTTDPLTLTAACLTLLFVATLAGLIPARRAAGVDPLVTLRCE
jgi:putative ABC transport system permease protein